MVLPFSTTVDNSVISPILSKGVGGKLLFVILGVAQPIKTATDKNKTVANILIDFIINLNIFNTIISQNVI